VTCGHGVGTGAAQEGARSGGEATGGRARGRGRATQGRRGQPPTHTRRPSYCIIAVRYAEFTPRPVNQAGAHGEEAGRRLANGGARQRRRRGKMHKRRAYRVSGLLWNDGIMRL